MKRVPQVERPARKERVPHVERPVLMKIGYSLRQHFDPVTGPCSEAGPMPAAMAAAMAKLSAMDAEPKELADAV